MISLLDRPTSARHRLLSVVALIASIALPTQSQAFDVCDNKIEGGEPHDAFSNLQHGVIGHVLAENVCGASPTPYAAKYPGVVERGGCLPGTAVYQEMTKWIAAAEMFALKISVPDGDSAVELSPNVTQKRARAWADAFGGCEPLLEVHDAQIPPLILDDELGPAPPGSRNVNR